MGPRPLTITLCEWIKIPSNALPHLLFRKIQQRLVFPNPEYELRHLRGDWIGGIPPQINCIRMLGRYLLLPRGFLGELLELLERMRYPYKLLDKRRMFDPIAVEFFGQLKDYQQDAAESAMGNDFGTLIGGRKSGKTVIALYTIAQRAQPTLILIPRIELLDEWLTKIENFLQVPREKVGVFTPRLRRTGEFITIAYTAEAFRFWKKVKPFVGYLIVDECQRCSPKIFTHLVTNFDCRYMLGLSAPIQQRERIARLMCYYIGNVVYTIDEKDAREGRGSIQAEIVVRNTNFDYPYRSRMDFVPMLQTLMRDRDRTQLIIEDVEKEVKDAKGAVLILSGGEEQNRVLAEELEKREIKAVVLDSKFPEKGRNQPSRVYESLSPSEGSERPTALVVSVEHFLKAGAINNKDTRVLFLAAPIYFQKPLEQAIRALSRNGNERGKYLKIYDYVDCHVSLLQNYFRMRSYSYDKSSLYSFTTDKER